MRKKISAPKNWNEQRDERLFFAYNLLVAIILLAAAGLSHFNSRAHQAAVASRAQILLDAVRAGDIQGGVRL